MRVGGVLHPHSWGSCILPGFGVAWPHGHPSHGPPTSEAKPLSTPRGENGPKVPPVGGLSGCQSSTGLGAAVSGSEGVTLTVSPVCSEMSVPRAAYWLLHSWAVCVWAGH